MNFLANMLVVVDVIVVSGAEIQNWAMNIVRVDI